jgi:hypothetical protein
MLVLTVATAVQRFVKVWRQAAAAPVVMEKQAARRSRRQSRRSARQARFAEIRRRRQS